MVLLLNTNSTDSVAGGSAVRHTEDAAPIINELLTFVCSGTSHSSWDTIEDIVTTFYSGKEIIDAGVLLLQHIGHLVTFERVTRVTDSKAHLQNIVSSISRMVENDEPMPVKFCAMNLEKLPRVAPEHINRESMATQILALQKQMEDIVMKVDGNTNSINVINTNRSYSSIVSQPVVHPQNNTNMQHPAVTVIDKDERRSAGTAPGLKFSSFQSPHVAPVHVIAPAPTITNSQWEQQKQERRRVVREKVKDAQESGRGLIGSSTGGNIIGSFPAKVVHVGNVNNDVTEDVLTAHLKSKDIHIFNVRTVSHKDSYRKSFRVVFKEADNTKLMKPEVWGEGITVREWVSNRE